MRVSQHTEFGEKARRWVLAQRPNGLLLRSPLLEQSELWIAARPRGAPVPTAETRAYISLSRQAHSRRKVRTLVLTCGVLIGIVIVLICWIMAH
jgi:hypothetical protein